MKPRRLVPRILVALALPLLAFACSDATSAHPAAHLRVVSGAGSSDTIMALSPVPLIVEVRDSSGQPAANLAVHFESQLPAGVDSYRVERGVYVCGAVNRRCSTYVDDQDYSVNTEWDQVTDSLGQAFIGVQYGVIAGHTAVEVTVPSLGVSTSAPFTTLPGNIAGVIASVPDTAIYVGRSYALTASAADRFRNPRSGSVTLRALTPLVAALSGGRVTAESIGRARMEMTVGAIVDTAYASVPPPGRLVMFGGGLTLLNTDGSDRRTIIATGGDHGTALPVWTADGAHIVFEELGSDQSEELQIVDTLGTRHALFAPTDSVSQSIQPNIGAQDGLLYFAGKKQGMNAGIYRAHTDGSAIMLLVSGVQPAPSPDGSSLAYVSAGSVLVTFLATDFPTTIAVPGPAYPRWSPSGELIAFSDNFGLHVDVVRPDGTGLRSLGVPTNSAVSWSPDSQWLVVSHYTGFPGNRPSDPGVELIRVSDGEQLPIPWTRDLQQPAWRPTP